MGRLILEYRDGDRITHLERTVRADELGIYNVRRHHLAAALTQGGQQLVNGAGLSAVGGEDAARRLADAFQAAAEESGVHADNDRFWLKLADIAATELPRIH